MTEKVNGWRNLVIGILSAVVLTAASGWFMWGNDRPTRDQVSGMIRVESPYVEDRQSVRQLQTTVERLIASVTTLTAEVAELRAELRTERLRGSN